jgi:hypothetical protein
MQIHSQDSIFFALGKANHTKDYIVLGVFDFLDNEVVGKNPFDMKYTFGKYTCLSRSFDAVYLVSASYSDAHGKDLIRFSCQLGRDDYEIISERKIGGLFMDSSDESMNVNYPRVFDSSIEPHLCLKVEKGVVYEKTENKFTGVSWREAGLDITNDIGIFGNIMLNLFGELPKQEDYDEYDEQ